MIPATDLKAGDHVILRNGLPATVTKLSDRGPWALVRYDKPQPYKDCVIRSACVDVVRTIVALEETR